METVTASITMRVMSLSAMVTRYGSRGRPYLKIPTKVKTAKRGALAKARLLQSESCLEYSLGFLTGQAAGFRSDLREDFYCLFP